MDNTETLLIKLMASLQADKAKGLAANARGDRGNSITPVEVILYDRATTILAGFRGYFTEHGTTASQADMLIRVFDCVEY